MVGKFCYTDNPTTYYEYFPADEYDVKHFSRLDVYKVDGEVHAVMVGVTNGGIGCVAELFNSTPSSANFSLYKTLLNDEVFDDIAVTDNYVVTTSRVPSSYVGYYRLYLRSTTTGMDMFVTTGFLANNMAYAMGFVVTDTVMAEYCENDVFAVATRSFEGNGTEVAAYDPLLEIASVHIAPYGNDTLCVPKDIKYDTSTRDLHLLQGATCLGSVGSLVSHLDATMVTGWGSVPGHFYDKHELFSIDRLNYQPGRVIATGRPQMFLIPPVTWVYFHDAASWKDCTEGKIVMYTAPKEWTASDIPIGLDLGGTTIRVEATGVEPEEVELDIICK